MIQYALRAWTACGNEQADLIPRGMHISNGPIFFSRGTITLTPLKLADCSLIVPCTKKKFQVCPVQPVVSEEIHNFNWNNLVLSRETVSLNMCQLQRPPFHNLIGMWKRLFLHCVVSMNYVSRERSFYYVADVCTGWSGSSFASCIASYEVTA